MKDVSISFEKPGVYAVLGPNGSGKTTILKIMAGLVKESSGSVRRFRNEDRIFLEEFLEHSGVAIGSPIFRPSLTGRDLLSLAVRVKGVRGMENEIERVSAIMKLDDFIDNEMMNYSSGMLQRILIANAIIGDPELLILDEPTAGLDPKSRTIVHELIRSYSECPNKTVIFSTHDVWEADSLSHYFVFIENGSLISNMIENSKKDYVFCALADSNQILEDRHSPINASRMRFDVVDLANWDSYRKTHEDELIEYHRCSKDIAEYVSQQEIKKIKENDG